MMRLCPKCGDYYADASLAFCLSDGAPLINVSLERWSEGARVIEGKERALREQKRKLKWRRIAVSTMAMVTLVVAVMAVNSFISIETTRPGNVAALPSTPETVPAVPGDSIPPGTPGETMPTPTPEPTVTPKPTATPVVKETPPRDTTSTITPTPTPTPDMTRTPTPPHTPTPTPTVTITVTTPDLPTIFSIPDKPLTCSDTDKSRERETIIRRFGNIWRRNIEGERRRIIAQNVPAGVENAEATLGEIEYQTTFFNACLASNVTAKYVWQVKARANPQEPEKVVTVPKGKRFTCVKVGETWLCN